MTTTLEEKFEAFELQLADQHDSIANKLDAILEALGAPPPTATTTLVTVVTALAAMQAAQLTQHNALMELIGLINTNTDTIINNNSLNAQKLIAAIYATFCGCATDIPLLTPPLDVTPTTLVDDEKCRRIQFYLSLFGTWLFDVANYGSSGAAITGDVLFSLLGAAATAVGLATTGAEAGTIFGIPGTVVGAVVGLIIGAVYFLGGTQLVNYANDFNDPTLRDNMVQAMYAATNADEGYTAFKTTLLATIGGAAGEVIYTLWWSAWSNDVYSGVPTVDDSAFDGSICVPAVECVTIDAVHYTVASGGSGYGISADFGSFTPEATVNTSSGPVTFSPGIFYNGDLTGWTMYVLAGSCYVEHRASGISSTDSMIDTAGYGVDALTAISLPTCGTFAFVCTDGTTLKLCPPS
jgi:hypothetical protein